MIYPVITLYQPWATWIMRGWKTIETRTHDRFRCLTGQTILIHAGQKTDESAIKTPYLTVEQILFNPSEIVNGFILGSVLVENSFWLSSAHSKKALIDCHDTKRFGLVLSKIFPFQKPIPTKGAMGIWYFDIKAMVKVSKPTNQTDLW